MGNKQWVVSGVSSDSMEKGSIFGITDSLTLYHLAVVTQHEMVFWCVDVRDCGGLGLFEG